MLSLLLDAAWMTLGLALASLVGGMVLALAFSAAELSKQRALVWPVATLTTLIRGLPELLVVLFIYFGSTQVLFLITGEYVEFSPFACGVLALSLLFASYATQTLRAALNAVPAGQRLAALAAEPVLERVLLSTGGVGYLGFRATAEADGSLRLTVPLRQVDDILKSLTILGAGGAVRAVTLLGPTPLADLFRDVPFAEGDLRGALQPVDLDRRGAIVERAVAELAPFV